DIDEGATPATCLHSRAVLPGGHRHAPELSGVPGVYSQYAVLISWSVLTRQSAIRCAEARAERLCQQVAQLTRAVLMPPRVSSSHAAPAFVSCSAPQCGLNPCKAQDQPAVGSRDTDK